MRHRPLTLAIAAILALPPTTALAQDHGERARELDAVVVQATPLRQQADDVARPVEILAGPALDDARAATIGESVSRLPGVQSSFFGPGVGRPIIRGLEGSRVQVLGEGLGTQDASTVSVDHAVSIDPFLADQIEVIKGPATLLFGSGAIGGAVNVVDGRIHETRAEGGSGRVEVRGNDVADERAGSARFDAGAGPWVFHVDGFHRETDDYEIPAYAEVDGDGHEHGVSGDAHEDEVFGVLENSATRTRGGAVGISHVGERGFVGVSLSRYESLYGVPGHHHEHEAEEDETLLSALLGEDEPEEEQVVIDLRQTRIDLKAGIDDPLPGHQRLRLRLGHANYTHTELEGDEIGTRFDNDGVDGRLEMVLAEMGGWQGAWGLQFGRRDFLAVGEEAFVPPSQTRDLGVFFLERQAWDRVDLEFGARYDRVSVDPDGGDGEELRDRSFGAFSASVAGQWRFDERWHLRLGLDRTQRAPVAEELYSDGFHVATGAVEIGNPDLDRETARQVELGLHYHGERVELKLAAYRSDFDGFIFLHEEHGHPEGLTGGDHEEPELLWVQEDAEFRGAEAEAKIALAEGPGGRFQLRLMADTVRGELKDGGNLPRVAPARYGTGFEWSLGGWRAGVSALRYRTQDDVAEEESVTPGFTAVDADFAYAFAVGDAELEVFVQGRNLGDEEIRLHTSFLKDRAPLPGRSLGAGLRAYF